MKTGSERAERVRNQRIWPFKSPIYSAFGGEFGDIRVFFSLCIIIVTRLCASATRLLASEGGCSREGLHQCHESGFPQPFAGREGGQHWGQGQWKIFYSSAGLEDAQATVSKNRWILYGEAGRISINLHISGTERHALQACAHFLLGSHWLLELASFKTCHHPASTANNQGLFCRPEAV